MTLSLARFQQGTFEGVGGGHLAVLSGVGPEGLEVFGAVNSPYDELVKLSP